MGQTPGDFGHHCSESFKGCCNTWVFLFSLGELGQSLANDCSFCFGVFESLERWELGKRLYTLGQTMLRGLNCPVGRHQCSTTAVPVKWK